MALYGNTAIIGYPNDDYMGELSGSVYGFIRQEDGTWEEVHKITAADGGSGDHFVWIFAISGDTDVIGAFYGDEEWVYDIEYGYVYIKMGRECIKNEKIVPEDGTSSDWLWVSVSLLGSTALFGAPPCRKRKLLLCIHY